MFSQIISNHLKKTSLLVARVYKQNVLCTSGFRQLSWALSPSVCGSVKKQVASSSAFTNNVNHEHCVSYVSVRGQHDWGKEIRPPQPTMFAPFPHLMTPPTGEERLRIYRRPDIIKTREEDRNSYEIVTTRQMLGQNFNPSDLVQGIMKAFTVTRSNISNGKLYEMTPGMMTEEASDEIRENWHKYPSSLKELYKKLKGTEYEPAFVRPVIVPQEIGSSSTENNKTLKMEVVIMPTMSLHNYVKYSFLPFSRGQHHVHVLRLKLKKGHSQTDWIIDYYDIWHHIHLKKYCEDLEDAFGR